MDYALRELLIFAPKEAWGAHLLANLQEKGNYQASLVHSPHELHQAIDEKKIVDAIIIDDGLVNDDFETEAGYPALPILWLGHKKNHPQLTASPSYWLEKPFYFKVLEQKLLDLIMAHEKPYEVEFILNHQITISPAKKIMTVQKGNYAQALTDKEVLILQHLWRVYGKDCSRESLLWRLWGYQAEMTTHTLETHIYRLRRKFEILLKNLPNLKSPLITTKGGYQLARFL